MIKLEHAKDFFERALGRRRDINAVIRQAGSFATQQCRVLDISRKDVRLKVLDADNIPDRFVLLFSKSGPGYSASVTWRRGTEIGAQFSANSARPLV